MDELILRVWDNVDCMTCFTLKDLQSKKIQFTSDCPIMLFFGLKDKNNKAIFVGDILKYDFNWDFDGGYEKTNRVFKKETKKHKPYIGRVEWHITEYSGFVIEGISEGHTRLNISTSSMLIEVIGNIYQHPELLKSLNKN